MNVGGGEAADQMVRMMLSGSEVAVRLSGSAMKNLLALTLALAQNHKTLSGKVNMRRMLGQTRDIRVFPMSPAQYGQFKKLAGKQKLLYSVIRDADGKGKLLDVVMPVTEIDRANLIFERMRYREQPEHNAASQKQAAEKGMQPEHAGASKEQLPKKESRSGQGSRDTKGSSGSARDTTKTKYKRPSVQGRLEGYRKQLQTKQPRTVPAKVKNKSR